MCPFSVCGFSAKVHVKFELHSEQWCCPQTPAKNQNAFRNLPLNQSSSLSTLNTFIFKQIKFNIEFCSLVGWRTRLAVKGNEITVIHSFIGGTNLNKHCKSIALTGWNWYQKEETKMLECGSFPCLKACSLWKRQPEEGGLIMESGRKTKIL